MLSCSGTPKPHVARPVTARPPAKLNHIVSLAFAKSESTATKLLTSQVAVLAP